MMNHPGLWIADKLGEELHGKDLDAWAVSCLEDPEHSDTATTTCLMVGYLDGYEAAIADARRLFDEFEKSGC